MRYGPPRDEEGMILINVLLFIAIASGILLLMISAEDSGLERGLRMREAARAMAIARGGELTAVTALRRDALVAPDIDSRAEPWGTLAEQGAPIEGGSFDLAIADAQDRFNINGVRTTDPAALVTLGKIAAAAGLTSEQSEKAVAAVRQFGPISDLRPLGQIGLSEAQIIRLSGLLTALPADSMINLNAASEDMIAVLTGDAMVARRLVALRQQQGYLTATDLGSLKISLPLGTSLTSNMFWVRTRVRIGDTSQQLTSLILRKEIAPGQKTTQVIERWTGSSAPIQTAGL